MLFNVLFLDLKYPFFGKFGAKSQNCHFKVKFCTQTNLKTENSIVAFTLSVFDWKMLFWANLIPKVSSNIDQVIRSVLNFLFFMIRFHKYKKPKKEYKALKALSTY